MPEIVFCKCGDAVVDQVDERCYKCMKRDPESPGYEPGPLERSVSADGLSEEENAQFWGVFSCYTGLVFFVGFLLGWVVKGCAS